MGVIGSKSYDSVKAQVWHNSSMEGASSEDLNSSFDNQRLSGRFKGQFTVGSCISDARERSYRDSSGTGYLSGFLQSAIFGAKTKRQMATSNRSFSVKQISDRAAFPNGNCEVHSKLLNKGGMDYVHRFNGCILSFADQKKVSEVFQVSLSRSGISIPGDALWVGNSSFGIHSGRQRVQGHSDISANTPQPVFGRLAESGSIEANLFKEDSQSIESGDFSWLVAKFSKIAIDSDTDIPVSRRVVRFKTGKGLSHRAKVGKNFLQAKTFSTSRFNVSETVDVSDRSIPGDNVTGTVEPSPLASSSVGIKGRMEVLSVTRKAGKNQPTSSNCSEMVGSGTHSEQGGSFTPSSSSSVTLHGRLVSGLGCTLRNERSSGSLDRVGASTPYKSVRIKSSSASPGTIGSISAQQGGISPLRQFHGGCLCSKSRRNKNCRQHGNRLEHTNVRRKERHHSPHASHTRRIKCSSGQAIKERSDTPRRVEPQSPGFSKSVQTKGKTNVGPLCDIVKRKTSPLRESDSGRKRRRGGCTEYVLEGVGPLCFSPHKTDHNSSKKSSRRTVQATLDSTGLAKSDLVSRFDTVGTGRTSSTSAHSNTVEATRQSTGLRQECSDAQPSRVDDRYAELISQGYSKPLAERICAPQRQSTRALYNSRVAGFVSWSKDNGLDGSNPTILSIAQFFEYLFEVKKWKPVTIRGYKSALADHFSPTGIDIRTSQVLLRLLSRFFLERPVARSPVLPWDLRMVLDTLKGKPFEPLSSSDLKHLTFKTLFLFAFACGRRCSELHALDFKSIKWLKKDNQHYLTVSPMLGFLAKNQKTTTYKVMDVTIPSLKDYLGPDLQNTSDRYLCPIRAMKFYLDRTKDMRMGKERLFISFLPGKEGDICKNTVSSWLRNTIQLAYQINTGDSTLPEGSRPHQVRSAASSWALKGGVNMAQLMEACFWRSQDTFTSFYLKDCWSQSEDKFSLGPVVSAGSVVRN